MKVSIVGGIVSGLCGAACLVVSSSAIHAAPPLPVQTLAHRTTVTSGVTIQPVSHRSYYSGFRSSGYRNYGFRSNYGGSRYGYRSYGYSRYGYGGYGYRSYGYRGFGYGGYSSYRPSYYSYRPTYSYWTSPRIVGAPRRV